MLKGITMIIGIGVDMVRVERIQKAIENNDHFRDRVFTPDEQAYCQRYATPWEKYAARFAAKEAFMKVVGKGLSACSFQDIEVLNKESGEPYYRFGPGADELLQSLNIRTVSLSMSHDGGTAIAFAVGED
jgi:phosphopantetheine--protein transferase-like protein